jgi:hypothetical protein
MEHQGGNFIKLVARSQFFFSADREVLECMHAMLGECSCSLIATWVPHGCSLFHQVMQTVTCIDQVLGVERMPYSIDGSRSCFTALALKELDWANIS